MDNTADLEAHYEQSPWHKEHIESAHPELVGLIQADNEWHRFPPAPRRVGKYRVFEGRYFQAVYAKFPNPVFDKLATLHPVDSEDDGEWAIWKLDEKDDEEGYGITSRSTVGFGPFNHHVEAKEWLERHALDLEYHNFHVMGVAYFTNIEPGCLLDAMRRLRWLGEMLRRLMGQQERLDQQFWRTLKRESDRVVSKLDASVDPEEIVPTLERFEERLPKRRTASVLKKS